MEQTEKLILASASPRRRELLAQVGYPFEVLTVPVEENLPRTLPPEEYAMRTAEKKACAVMERVGEGRLVLAADTVVVRCGEILGKPQDAEDAARMLRRLAGGRHEVVTGCALGCGARMELFFERTYVWMRALSDREIAAYVKTGEPLDKAGSYGIQGRGALLVERIEGDYFNVVGLPLCRIGREMDSFFEIDLAR